MHKSRLRICRTRLRVVYPLRALRHPLIIHIRLHPPFRLRLRPNLCIIPSNMAARMPCRKGPRDTTHLHTLVLLVPTVRALQHIIHTTRLLTSLPVPLTIDPPMRNASLIMPHITAKALRRSNHIGLLRRFLRLYHREGRTTPMEAVYRRNIQIPRPFLRRDFLHRNQTLPP